MIMILALFGGIYLLSKTVNRTVDGGIAVNIPKAIGYKPWAESTPSNAGSTGTGQTSPLSAFLGAFTRGFGAPAAYVPLSGPGGATALPAASGAPAGQAPNTLLAAAPGTEPEYNATVAQDLAGLSSPANWWMSQAVDVAIMSDDVAGAMANSGQMDLSPSMVEASLGMSL